MLIDFHTHAFPDVISKKAIEKLSYVSGGLKPQSEGTVSSLRNEMEKVGLLKIYKNSIHLRACFY
jgi:hypothetical protein